MKHSMMILVVLFSIFVSAAVVSAGRVDEHAPIGVMADHQHKKGEWMASYRYMRMDMPKNFSGTKELTVEQVHNAYMVSPIRMTMEMHMLGIMYGMHDDLTAMVMVPYIKKSMDHRRRFDGHQFKTRSEGLGDVRVSVMFSLRKFIDLPMHATMGASLPTGSINQRDDTLVGPDRNLPYPMQLGSGAPALLPGITYLDKRDAWSWGAQANAAIQVGRNEEKYQWGNAYDLTTWIAYKWQEWISTSLRLKGSKWGNIDGADSRINPNMIPTSDANRRGGERVDVFFGVNLLGQTGFLHDHRLALEVGVPIYQRLDGPQLGFGVQGTIGWQKAW